MLLLLVLERNGGSECRYKKTARKGRTVNQLGRVVHNGFYLAVLLEMTDGYAGETAVYLEALDEDALGDEPEGGDFLHYAVKGGLVEGDCVLGLVLDLSLGPLLFLCGLAATGRGGFRGSFSLGRILRIVR
jgi:hypothetical protein